MLFDDNSLNKISQLNFPRQKSGNNLCIADFYCDLKNDKPIDIFPMQAVTMGDIASEYSQKLFKEDKYSCLLYTSPSPRDLLGSRMPSSA